MDLSRQTIQPAAVGNIELMTKHRTGLMPRVPSRCTFSILDRPCWQAAATPVSGHTLVRRMRTEKDGSARAKLRVSRAVVYTDTPLHTLIGCFSNRLNAFAACS